VKGSLFAAEYVRAPDQAARDALVLDAVFAKDAWLRWPSVVVNVEAGGHTYGLIVACDYFAIGEADDYVRTPCNARTAQEIADKLGFQIPNARIVDLIWIAAATKLIPITAGDLGIALGGQQMSGQACMQHTRAVDAQLPPGPVALRAGCKKDIIISNRLADAPQKRPGAVEGMSYNRDGVGIYGWHLPKGSAGCQLPTLPGLCPIQGRSFAHPWSYADYSHGLRMVGKQAFVDGEPIALSTLLTDPEISKTFSDEGPLRVFRYGGPVVVGGGGSGGGGAWCQGFVECAVPPSSAPSGTALALGVGALVVGGAALWYGGYL